MNEKKPYLAIPSGVLRRKAKDKTMLVHVEGWNPACVFRYLGTVAGVHQLETPKRRKAYTVPASRNLMYTRSAQMVIEQKQSNKD